MTIKGLDKAQADHDSAEPSSEGLCCICFPDTCDFCGEPRSAHGDDDDHDHAIACETFEDPSGFCAECASREKGDDDA